MRRRTPKRSAQERQYLARRVVYLEDRPCAGFGVIDGCQGRADTIHHRRGRRGDDLLREENWVALCWEPCHKYVTDHPAEAMSAGLSASRVGVRP